MSNYNLPLTATLSCVSNNTISNMRLNLGVISQLSNISYKIVIVLHAYHTIVIRLLISETIGVVRLIFLLIYRKCWNSKSKHAIQCGIYHGMYTATDVWFKCLSYPFITFRPLLTPVFFVILQTLYRNLYWRLPSISFSIMLWFYLSIFFSGSLMLSWLTCQIMNHYLI